MLQSRGARLRVETAERTIIRPLPRTKACCGCRANKETILTAKRSHRRRSSMSEDRISATSERLSPRESFGRNSSRVETGESTVIIIICYYDSMYHQNIRAGANISYTASSSRLTSLYLLWGFVLVYWRSKFKIYDAFIRFLRLMLRGSLSS